MDKENNIVYVQTKKGIFKCYKSEQMHKPIYYPVESKTNGYIDYYDVIEILNINDLYEQCKKQKEVVDRILNETKETRNILNNNRDDNMLSKSCLLSYLEIVEDLLKEVSE